MSTNDIEVPPLDNRVIAISLDDMNLNYESIASNIDIDSEKSYVLIDEDNNYYATVVSNDNKKGIVNVKDTNFNDESFKF